VGTDRGLCEVERPPKRRVTGLRDPVLLDRHRDVPAGLWAAGYLLACWWWPYRACWRCPRRQEATQPWAAGAACMPAVHRRRPSATGRVAGSGPVAATSPAASTGGDRHVSHDRPPARRHRPPRHARTRGYRDRHRVASEVEQDANTVIRTLLQKCMDRQHLLVAAFASSGRTMSQ